MEETKKISKKSVTVLTGAFQFAHGHKPRGRGQWWFGAENGETFQAGFNKTYSEAKQEAIAWAASEGFRLIKVLS